MEIAQTLKTVDAIISSFKKARKENDYNTILSNGLALLEYCPNLIDYSVSQEAEYRKLEASILNTADEAGKARSGAYAEAQAKASEFYKEWNKTKQFIELVYQLVAMSKKIASGVDTEFKSQFNN